MAAISVTTSATALTSASGNRSGIVMVNLSDTDIYVAPRNTVTATEDANTGIRIPAGGSFTVAPSQVSRLSMEAAWYGRHAGAGNKTLTVETL